jgi:hypothetical protein
MKLALGRGKTRKAMSSSIMHVSSKIWKERNARVFFTPKHRWLSLWSLGLREEAGHAWCLAEATILRNGITGN